MRHMVESQRNTIDHGGWCCSRRRRGRLVGRSRRQPVEHDLELVPRYWRITRTRLDREELDREVGWLRVPELPLPTMLPSDAIATPPSPAP
jgi:hypothetical protein